MTENIMFEPHFDWLTASYERFETSLATLSSKYPNARIFEEDKGNGNKNWLTQSGFYDDYYKILQDDNSVSRIDIALDVKMDFEDVVSGVFEVRRLKFDRYVVSKTGRTYYYGVGDLVLRVYEKGKQLKLDGFDDWVRIEFQLRGRKARKMLDEFDSQAYSIFSALYSKYITYYAITGFTSEKDFSFLHDTQDRYAYIDKNIIPYLNRLKNSTDDHSRKLFEYFCDRFCKMISH